MAVYGNLPSENQLADWEFAVSQHSAVPQGILVKLCSVKLLVKIWFAKPMDMLCRAQKTDF